MNPWWAWEHHAEVACEVCWPQSEHGLCSQGLRVVKAARGTLGKVSSDSGFHSFLITNQHWLVPHKDPVASVWAERVTSRGAMQVDRAGDTAGGGDASEHSTNLLSVFVFSNVY